MDGDSAHWRSPNKAFCPAKIFQLGRQFFDRFRGNAGVEPVRLVPFFVQKRSCAEHGMMRENAPAENDGIRSRETVFANLDRLRGLATSGEIDAVGEQLRPKAADRRERADSHARRAINQMPAADAGMPFYDQLRATLRLVRELQARAAGETGDPIQLPDNRVRAEME